MRSTQRSSNPFSAAYLERRNEARLDADWPQNVRSDPTARFIVSRGTQHLVRREPEAAIAFVGAADPIVQAADASQLLLLGWYRDTPCVLLAVAVDTPVNFPGAVLEELRPLMHVLSEQEAGLLTCARALLVWRARHRHCGVCGAPTVPRNAGHVLTCTSSECGEEFFPRIDPAIIVLVTDGVHALLGRQSSWPAARYSALAGFVEVGESLEDTVAREVYEETGVRISATHYFGSQPWPFPSSLMLGFHAHAPRSPVTLDGELEDARWFTAAELRAAPAALLPPPHTIARRLLEAWFDGLDQAGGQTD